MDNLGLPTLRTSSRIANPNLRNLTSITAESREAKDLIVQQTDQDASQSRLSAVEAGYLTDPFASSFCTQKGSRKYPLINRGTFVRTTALDRLVHAFLSAPSPASSSTKKQILSLGAGSDTRYFRLRQTLPPATLNALDYHEFDFAAVTAPKVAAILRARLLAPDEITAVDEAAGTLRSAGYSIHAQDLRSLRALPDGVDPAAPTLLVSECCLIYLAPEEADGIVRWACGAFSGAVGMVVYEPIGGEDAFGRVMVQNLATRGIVLRTLNKYATLERQRMRFRVLGLADGQEAVDVYFASERWVEEKEKERIARLEMLDEMEEWQMLARHYCLAWAWRGDEFSAAWDGAFPTQKE